MARRDASGTWDESKVPGSRAEATLTATTEGDRIVVASEGEPVEVWSALPGQPFQRESISESDGVAPFLVSDQRSAVIGLVAGAPRAGERRFALLRRDAASGFRTVASTELATDERIVGAGEGVAVWFVTGPSGSRVLWAHGGSLRSAALSLASDDGTPLRPPVSVRAFRDGACLTVVRVHVDGMVTPAAWTTVIDTLAWPPGPT
ncbi:MAG: hypothetical protein KC731_29175 [Myxococcales bacterium]|nr:hypothetical protein [Myxococcales bacterium]